MNIVLFGGPGAGKGTQSEFLKTEFGMLHISTGDLLREGIANQTEAGMKAKSFMDAGELVPDEVILGIMQEKFETSDLSNGLILDGFPRNIKQATALDKMLDGLDTQIDKAILIDTPNDIIIQRICSRRMCKSCGRIGSVLGLNAQDAAAYVCPDCGGEMYQREDDNEATVQNRIDVYMEKTAPLIDYYSKQNKLAKVDGSPSVPKEVFENLKAVLE